MTYQGLYKTKKAHSAPAFLLLILIIQNLTVFFTDIIGYVTVTQAICVVLLLAYIINNDRRIIIQKFLYLWFAFVLLVVLNYFIGGDINFILFFLINSVLIVEALSIKNIGYYELTIAKICCWVHLISSLAVYFLPAGITNTVINALLGAQASSNYSWRMLSKVNPGITSQPGLNAMFLALLILIYAAEMIVTNKNKPVRIIIIVVAFSMILTTAKRSALAVTLIAILFFWLLVRRRTGKRLTISKIIGFFVAVVALAMVVRYLYVSTTLFSSVIEKMQLLRTAGDVSNGRFSLSSYAMEVFKRHPILGSGLKSIYKETGFDVHNTYIQILAETGLVGFIVFVLGIGLILFYSIKRTYFVLGTKELEEYKTVAGTGLTLLLFLLLYGFMGNTFIDYTPLMLFSVSLIMANTTYDVRGERL